MTMKTELRRTVYRVYFADRRQEVLDGAQLEVAIREGRVGTDDRVALSDGPARRFWEFPRFAALRPGNERVTGSGADLDDTDVPVTRPNILTPRTNATSVGVAVAVAGQHADAAADALIDARARAAEALRALETGARHHARRVGTPLGTVRAMTDSVSGPSLPASYKAVTDTAAGPSVPAGQRVLAETAESAVIADPTFEQRPITEPARPIRNPLESEAVESPTAEAASVPHAVVAPPAGLSTALFEEAIDQALRATSDHALAARRSATRSRTAPALAVSSTQVDEATRVLRWVAAGVGAVAFYAIMQLFTG